MQKEDIPKRLTYKYMTALTILVVILTMTQFVIYFHTVDQETDSRVINLSGRQRMLSQKIVKNSLIMDSANNVQEFNNAKGELVIALELWEKTQGGLIHGSEELGLPGNNTEAVVSMYNEIDIFYNNMVLGADILIATDFNDVHSNNWNEALESMKKNEKNFLLIMDKIVFAYDDLANAKVLRSISLERALYIFSLLAIVFEIIYIFKPAVHQIEESIDEVLQNEKNMQQLFNVTPNPLFLIDDKHLRIRKINAAAINLSGISEVALIDQSLSIFIPIDYVKDLINDPKYNESETMVKEIIFNDTLGNSLNMILTANIISLEHKIYYLINLTDISNRVINENKLKEMVTFDEMTGLLNRRTGLIMMKKEVLKAERELYQLAFCFIDLDGLKNINDLFGHTDGDWVIKESAKSILNSIREQDIAFRYGGDEYCIVFPNCSLTQAKAILERVEERINTANYTSKRPYEIGFSYGIVDVDKSTDYQIDKIIELADKEMYVMKNKKKADYARIQIINKK